MSLDVQDFTDSHRVQSGTVRGDVLFPFPLPPLPTVRPQPGRLDISHEREEVDLTSSGRGDSSGEGGSSDDGYSGAEVRTLVTPKQVLVETTFRPDLLFNC